MNKDISVSDKLLQKSDLVAYGAGATGYTSTVLIDLEQIARFSEQITIIASMVLVLVTLAHRLYVIWRDIKSSKEGSSKK